MSKMYLIVLSTLSSDSSYWPIFILFCHLKSGTDLWKNWIHNRHGYSHLKDHTFCCAFVLFFNGLLSWISNFEPRWDLSMFLWGWHADCCFVQRGFCPHHTFTCSKHTLLGNKLISVPSQNLTYSKHLSAAKAGRLNNKSLFVVRETYYTHWYQSTESGRFNHWGTWKCCLCSGSPARKGPRESQTNNICRNKFKNGFGQSMEFIKMKRQQAAQNLLLCTQFEVQPLKTCGWSKGQKVADRE